MQHASCCVLHVATVCLKAEPVWKTAIPYHPLPRYKDTPSKPPLTFSHENHRAPEALNFHLPRSVCPQTISRPNSPIRTLFPPFLFWAIIFSQISLVRHVGRGQWTYLTFQRLEKPSSLIPGKSGGSINNAPRVEISALHVVTNRVGMKAVVISDNRTTWWEIRENGTPPARRAESQLPERKGSESGKNMLLLQSRAPGTIHVVHSKHVRLVWKVHATRGNFPGFCFSSITVSARFVSWPAVF